MTLKKVSCDFIESLKESETYYKSLDSAIDPLKEELLGLCNNRGNLSDKEWMDRLKEFMREYQAYYPEIEGILKKIDTYGFPQQGKKRLRAFAAGLCDRIKADSLENAYQLAASLLNSDPIHRSNALDRLQWLCGLFNPTQEEHTQIFNRFLKEGMPPISRFAPYALGAVVWYFTVQLYLRENPENAAPINVLRDAQYLLYTYYKNVTFVSGDKWHKKFINEVPLFENIRENFIFIDLTTKTTIQAGFSKLL